LARLNRFEMRVFPILAAIGTAAVAAILLAVGQSPSAQPSHPVRAVHSHGLVLVELFQSQGCSSCPPAEANLNAIAGRADVVALSFGVTYWDRLGWRDTFARPEFTARQWDYARHNGRPNVATPQIWVNGRRTIVGNDPRQLDAVIAEAEAHGPELAVRGDRLSVGAAPAPDGGGDVWIVRYDPRTLYVPIRAGENGGRTLAHRNIVRRLVRAGHWNGAARTFALPAAEPGLATAVFVQVGPGGPIIAVARGS